VRAADPERLVVLRELSPRGRSNLVSARLYEDIRDFAVFEKDGHVVGVTAVSVIWADLCEVRSLAVDEKFIGQGIGRGLVEWCIAEARRLIEPYAAETMDPLVRQEARKVLGMIDQVDR